MNTSLQKKLTDHPNIYRIALKLLEIWPAHEKYLQMRFRDDDLDFLSDTDLIVELVLKLVGKELKTYCEDYKWMCDRFSEEQLYFRRFGEYRLKTFQEANASIYSDTAYMSRYVHGILMSQIFWRNHAQAINLFRSKFLEKCNNAYEYLEIGPGHGLFFYFAAKDPKSTSVTGWDVSRSSINATHNAMQTFGIPKSAYNLIKQDLMKMPINKPTFNVITISEVLEHLETPDIALKMLHHSLSPGGQIFINVPVNSPAPDHIFLWRSQDEVIKLVESCGFTIKEAYYLPIAGYSIETATTMNLDISCVIIGEK